MMVYLNVLSYVIPRYLSIGAYIVVITTILEESLDLYIGKTIHFSKQDGYTPEEID